MRMMKNGTRAAGPLLFRGEPSEQWCALTPLPGELSWRHSSGPGAPPLLGLYGKDRVGRGGLGPHLRGAWGVSNPLPPPPNLSAPSPHCQERKSERGRGWRYPPNAPGVWRYTRLPPPPRGPTGWGCGGRGRPWRSRGRRGSKPSTGTQGEGWGQGVPCGRAEGGAGLPGPPRHPPRDPK